MATYMTSETPQQVTDGISQVIMTASLGFKYGFGTTVPTTWHVYESVHLPLEVGTRYGKMWIKSYHNLQVEVSVTSE